MMLEMRTTLNIDYDVLETAKSLAEARQVSIGKALSDLARRGTEARSPGVSRSGFFTFNLRGGSVAFGPEDVQAGMESENAGVAAQFPARKGP
jgi:hypothetical protein